MKKITEIIKKTLPISTLAGVLGWFYFIATIIYLLTKQFCHSIENQKIWFAAEGIVLFASLLVIYFICRIKEYKEEFEDEAYKDSQRCLNCIKEGFPNHGLLHLEELIAYEGELASSSNPRMCKVLIYTSDLAGEKDAETVVIENRRKKIQYIVLYFANSCTEEENRVIEKRYGKKNLVDLSKRNEYIESFDGNLAQTLGFDIMIYQECDGSIKGFFAVDFVPANRPTRDFHRANCNNKCNYAKVHPRAFYKKISDDIARQLFEDGMKLQKEMNTGA